MARFVAELEFLRGKITERKPNCMLRSCWKVLKSEEPSTEDTHGRTIQATTTKPVPGWVVTPPG